MEGALQGLAFEARMLLWSMVDNNMRILTFKNPWISPIEPLHIRLLRTLCDINGQNP
jgi:hypothetical protein